MNLTLFVEVYRSLWPTARDLDGAGYQALWSEAVGALPDRLVVAALRHLRRQGRWAPTIAEFETLTAEHVETWARRSERVDPQAAAWCAQHLTLRCACGDRWRGDPTGQARYARHTCDETRRGAALLRERVPPIGRLPTRLLPAPMRVADVVARVAGLPEAVGRDLVTALAAGARLPRLPGGHR